MKSYTCKTELRKAEGRICTKGGRMFTKILAGAMFKVFVLAGTVSPRVLILKLEECST